MEQALVNLAQTESSIPPLLIGLRQANDRLCVLLGQSPRDLVAELKEGRIPIGWPGPGRGHSGGSADPAARRAAGPAVTSPLSAPRSAWPRPISTRASPSPAFIGYAADDFATLFDSASFTAYVLPNFQWKILNYGRIRQQCPPAGGPPGGEDVSVPAGGAEGGPGSGRRPGRVRAIAPAIAKPGQGRGRRRALRGAGSWPSIGKAGSTSTACSPRNRPWSRSKTSSRSPTAISPWAGSLPCCQAFATRTVRFCRGCDQPVRASRLHGGQTPKRISNVRNVALKVHVEKNIGSGTLRIETGMLAKQAAGSCLVQYGETVVLDGRGLRPARGRAWPTSFR